MSGLLHTTGRRACAAAFLGLCALCSAASGVHTRTPAHLDPWDAAVEARSAFEASPNHTRATYTHVMDAFRAIYHDDPRDPHAGRAVEQVAELLTEQARELHDAKSLSDAEGQYTFLAKAYPAYAKSANAHLAELKHSEAASTPEPVHTREASAPANAHPIPVVEDTTPAPHHDAPQALASVTAIRHWSTPTYTRVAIDLGDEVTYQAARVENPDRIFFDLHHAKLAHELINKSFAITDDGFLTRIRAAQYSDDVTRVVLDVHEVGDYSAFLLPNPYRLIIDIHGKQQPGREVASNEAPAAPAPAPIERTPEPARQPQPIPVATPPAPAASPEYSTLPPTPVTDGTATFGLPTRKPDTAPPPPAATTPVPAPRVVIPTKPTTAKPVPNTVTSGASDRDIAAVSNQPGKVLATDIPTSAPIAARSSASTTDDHYRKPTHTAPDATPAPAAKLTPARHIAGEPTTPPPPTADGQATLMRALGLKIGRIVIDAGHGGHDSGTLGAGGIQEKDVVLDVALRLGKLLHDRLGAEIVYTRADDTFIPLETRTAIANKAQADLFISVHANSSQDTTARGVEVYYLNFTSDPDAMHVAARENAVSTQSVHELSDLVKKIALKDKIDESKELASDVDASLYKGLTTGTPQLVKTNAGIRDRGVKKAPFVVLIGANMPSILAEISFVTNPSDADELRTEDYRQRVAESLYNGVARYASGINGDKQQKPPRTERASAGGK